MDEPRRKKAKSNICVICNESTELVSDPKDSSYDKIYETIIRGRPLLVQGGHDKNSLFLNLG